jgi:hypothetical protein
VDDDEAEEDVSSAGADVDAEGCGVVAVWVLSSSSRIPNPSTRASNSSSLAIMDIVWEEKRGEFCRGSARWRY